ncbi:E3 ubiquitin-protein ligase rnf14, partial [Nowakowskiella sp. JEL0407]
ESNDNRNLQQLELEALNAIFPSSDEFVCKEDSSTGLFSGNLQINIALSEKTMLRYPAFQTVENLDLVANDAEPAQDDTLTQDVQVHHLPPISLHFTLPPLYPTLEPPELNLECFWLSFDLRNSLREKFLSMWEDDRGE